jgi:3-methyladenine DNA glycosylase AlkD
MTPTDIVTEIRQQLAANESWNVAALRELRRGFTRRLAKVDAALVLEVARLLIPHPGFVHRFLAYELVTHHRAAMAALTVGDVEALGQGMDSWAVVDTFGSYISGPAWREGRVSNARVHRWARSPDRWWRRAALVSSVPLNCKARGGQGDTPRTLAVCELLIADRDDMVVKAMSWALRELAKRAAAAVEAFLSKHAATLASRVIREVRNKLQTGLKNRS